MGDRKKLIVRCPHFRALWYLGVGKGVLSHHMFTLLMAYNSGVSCVLLLLLLLLSGESGKTDGGADEDSGRTV